MLWCLDIKCFFFFVVFLQDTGRVKRSWRNCRWRSVSSFLRALKEMQEEEVVVLCVNQTCRAGSRLCSAPCTGTATRHNIHTQAHSVPDGQSSVVFFTLKHSLGCVFKTCLDDEGPYITLMCLKCNTPLTSAVLDFSSFSVFTERRSAVFYSDAH